MNTYKLLPHLLVSISTTVCSIGFIAFDRSAMAQSQSFSQCVKKLQSGSYYKADAAQNCLEAFKGKSPNEDFSTCVQTLQSGPYYKSDAAEYCKKSQQQGTTNPDRQQSGIGDNKPQNIDRQQPDFIVNRQNRTGEIYRLCTLAPNGSKGATLYYSNGQKMTDYAGTVGATWYYPNGRKMTDYAGRDGATWYYSNGKKLTDYAGRTGATWYYPNGQKMSDYVGRDRSTWYYDNGQKITDNGNFIPKEDLLYPCNYIQ
ncbi:hypothetical protein [Chamaesiphon sp. VAR_48_metabat_403]|uniref:hypothetical protein n=1 Tax=Chamaesiphon sp. VAR_48_metabat_403 TaxID=2964700 RepID=UPI00286EA713|nr:hypothetical protein [Chamaesiphon sp. VAR_48_metabat_403]